MRPWLPWGQEMFTACGFLSVSNLSLLRLSPTRRPHPSHSAITPGGAARKAGVGGGGRGAGPGKGRRGWRPTPLRSGRPGATPLRALQVRRPPGAPRVQVREGTGRQPRDPAPTPSFPKPPGLDEDASLSAPRWLEEAAWGSPGAEGQRRFTKPLKPPGLGPGQCLHPSGSSGGLACGQGTQTQTPAPHPDVCLWVQWPFHPKK